MLKMGSYNELVVERAVEFGLYLNPKEEEVLLPSKYVPPGTRPGDTLRVFVYADSEGRPVATTLEPKASVGEFAFLEVRDVTPIGAFLDWGLEKDLLVPKSEQQERMRVGKRYVVKVCLDKRTNRVFATSRIAGNCEAASVGDLAIGQKVDLLVYGLTKIGVLAVVDNRYSGMLYRSEVYGPIEPGDRMTGYILKIREDGKLDLSLKVPGYKSIADSGASVLDALNSAGGFIPCHDRSDPEEIRRTFSMSKKEFKRAIGSLYKAGKIEIREDGIRIKTEKPGRASKSKKPRAKRG